MRLHSNSMHFMRVAVVVVLAGICLPGPKAMADYYSGGAGTAENPYLISTSDDLVQLSRSSSDWGGHFRMTKDIDMENVKGFRPIAPEKLTANGLQDLSFTGVFDGNGHVISNLVIDKPTSDSVGLFGHVGVHGEIRKLGLEAVRITGKDRVGGLVGTSEQGRITLCYAQGSVTGHENVGGLVGKNVSCSITACYASGNVKGNSSIGGLVGVNIESTISSCYARGTVTGDFFGIGGLAGLDIQSHIVSSYARVSVNGRGGLMGGLLGEGLDSQIQSCYAAGPVGKESRNKKGGLVGKSFEKTRITASFWDVDATGQNASEGGGVGLTTSEMQKKATFEEAGWDFETVWVMPDSGYPELRMLEAEETRPTGTNHADSPTRSKFSNRYSGGTGTAADPYLIANPDDLIRLSQRSPDWGNHFRMTEDIDMSGVKSFTLIAPDTATTNGFQGTSFTGVFDGDGHVISNLVIDQPTKDYVGLFGCISVAGEVRNLGLEAVHVTGRDRVGGLVGINDSGRIASCHVTGIVTGNEYVGGLVGSNLTSSIIACYTSGNVTGNRGVGGLTGFSNHCRLHSNYASVVVTGDSLAGGLAGAVMNTDILSCYAIGSVKGDSSLGGLVGGIKTSPIQSSYAVGTVKGNTLSGGLVGNNDDETPITSSFWDVDTSGQKTSGGGTGLTTAEMQRTATYEEAGWDFKKTWVMPESGYPQLRALTTKGHTPGSPGDETEEASGISPDSPDAYSGGTGLADNPYLISSPEDLITLSQRSSDWGSYFRVTEDIDMAGVKDFMPIGPDTATTKGYQGTPFTGVFDGDWHVISNLVIDQPERDCVGLFGCISLVGEVRNLGLEAIRVTGNTYVGGLAGLNKAGRIVACYVAGTITGQDAVGGLVGMNKNSRITLSHTEGMIKGDSFVGGLVGGNYKGQLVSNSTSASVKGDSSAGGFAGFNKEGKILSSYAIGKVEGDKLFTGGFTGDDEGTISACFWDLYTTTQLESKGGTGLTTDKMQVQATFEDAGWDFETVWIMPESGYPTLRWQMDRVSQAQEAETQHYSGGSGTAEDPYRIGTPADLVTLSKASADWGCHFRMVKDVDMRDITGFTPIAPNLTKYDEFQGTLFTGVFDGDEHVISHLTINQPRGICTGFMGGIGKGSVIRDLGLEDATITGEEVTGGLVAYNKEGEIHSCHVKGTIAGDVVVGGVVGFIHDGTITSCSFSGEVNGEAFIAGGILGGSIGGHVQFCSATGSVNSRHRVGGLMGQNRGCSIASSYATNAVSGRTRVGGLAGENLAGSCVESSYSTGAVTGKEKVGGLIGDNEGEVDSSFWDVDASGQNASAGGGTGLSTSEMQKKVTFEEAGWDFETVWVRPDSGYPELRVMEKKNEKANKNESGGEKK